MIMITVWVEDDGCKGTGEFVYGSIARAYGNEQFVWRSIGRVSATEGNAPEVVEDDLPAVSFLIVPTNSPVVGLNAVDGAVDGVVGNQQSIAQRPKIAGARAMPQP